MALDQPIERWLTLPALLLPFLATALPPLKVSAAQPATLICRASQNGEPAAASVSFSGSGSHQGEQRCTSAVRAKAGTYDVTVTLHGTVDTPSVKRKVTLPAGRRTVVSAAFSTGELQVGVESDGRAASGMAEVYRGKERVAIIGGNVRVRISAGRYDLVVKHHHRACAAVPVAVHEGKRTEVSAAFSAEDCRTRMTSP